MNPETPNSDKPSSERADKPATVDMPKAKIEAGLPRSKEKPSAGVGKISIPWQLALINFALYLLLIDMAVETLVGGRSVRWMVLVSVSVYLGVSAYVGWRYYAAWGSAIVRNGPWFSLVLFFALLYTSFIGFSGQEVGIQLMGLSAAQVLALVVAITLLLASVDFMRQKFVPIRWRQIGLGIAFYGVLAYLWAFFDKLSLAEIYGGKSFWSSLPLAWMQGVYVGPLLLIPLLLLTQVYGKLTNKFAVAWLRWVLNLLALSLCLGLVLSGIESAAKLKAVIPATVTPKPLTAPVPATTPIPGPIPSSEVKDPAQAKEKPAPEAPKAVPPEPKIPPAIPSPTPPPSPLVF